MSYSLLFPQDLKKFPPEPPEMPPNRVLKFLASYQMVHAETGTTRGKTLAKHHNPGFEFSFPDGSDLPAEGWNLHTYLFFLVQQHRNLDRNLLGQHGMIHIKNGGRHVTSVHMVLAVDDRGGVVMVDGWGTAHRCSGQWVAVWSM